jgi:hypothetical protein
MRYRSIVGGISPCCGSDGGGGGTTDGDDTDNHTGGVNEASTDVG